MKKPGTLFKGRVRKTAKKQAGKRPLTIGEALRRWERDEKQHRTFREPKESHE